MAREEVEALLRSYFSGKRAAVRTSTLLDVILEGPHGFFSGMAVDLSRTGILLRINDADFAMPDEEQHLMRYTSRVWHHFERGLAVLFPGVDLRALADVVRVTGYSGKGSCLILIGCHFREALDESICDKLGIEHAEDRAPGK
ncbi:MAG: PilZ domain-containing protein [Planctomycetes bacterium]|nr:PilZ domain-containing protein [Planctomycetota bacterium]